MRSRRTSRPAARPRAFAVETLEARDVPAVVPLGPEFQVNVSTPGQQFGPEIAAAPSGHHVVVWNTEIGGNYGVSARVFDADGVPVSGDIVVAADVGTNSSIASPSVCMDDAGRFLVTWSDGDDVFAKGYDADGSALTDAFVVNTTTAGYQKAPAAACDADGNFVVIWQSGASLYGNGLSIVGQRFDLDAEPVGGEFVVNTFATGAKQNPSVAMDADGDFVVAYESRGQDGPNGQAVYARLYAADGTPQGDEFVVAASAGNWRVAPDVAMDADGDFVVAWYHYRNAAQNGFDVSARRYDSAGTPAGAAFRVSPDVTDWGSPGASVAMDAAGRFVVAYPRYVGDGSGYGVYARAFDESGVAVGDEFRANSYTPDYQNLSAVEISDVGTFLVAWNSEQDGDSLGVFAQAYTLDGSAEDLAPITGIISTLATPDTASAAPFESVSFHHVPVGATLNVAVTFDEDKGDLSGPASMSGDLASVLAQLRALRFDPADNRVPIGLTETTTFTLTVTDGAGYAATDSRTNVVGVSVNAPPQVNGSLDTQTANAGQLFTFVLPEGFVTDPDSGDVLTFSADSLPAWLSIDPETGTLSGTPSPADAVVTTEPNVWVTVTATDLHGAYATFPVAINVLDPDAAPYYAGGYTPDISVDEDSAFDEAASSMFASQFRPGYPGNPLSVTITGTPSWMTYDAAADRLFGTPTQADVGTDGFIHVGVTDTVNGRSTGASFRVVVVNVNDPVFLVQPIDDRAALAGTPFAFTVPVETFSDEDADENPYYQTSELPEWLAFNSYSGEFAGTPTSADVGTVSITVTRTDSGGSFASDTFDLTVSSSNSAPQVNGSLETQTAYAGESFTFALPEGFVTDADPGDVLTFTGILPGWLSIDPETGTLSGTPTAADAVIGTTEPNVFAEVTATDASGEWVAFGVPILVLDPDAPPYFVSGNYPPLYVYEDSYFEEAGLFTSAFRPAVPEHGLSFSFGQLPAWLSYDSATDRLTGTPLQADVGTNYVERVATDTVNGNSTSHYFEIVVVNVNDPATLEQPLADQSALAGTPFTFTVPVETFFDEDGNEYISYQTSELPEWLSFNPYTGEFAGTPTNADVGTVSVTVIRDGASDTFDLTVLPSNHAPTVASPLGTVTATEDEAFSFVVPAETFADADGDELTLAVAGMPGWLSFDAATGTISGTPGNDDVGSVTLSLTATDPHGVGVTDTFTLAVADVNDAPTVAVQPYNQTAFAHAPFSTTLPANTFADIDAGDVLTLSAAEMPAWMSFDPATRRFSGTPTHADAGSSLVRVTATDLAGASVSATFGVRVVSANRAPTVSGTASGAIVRDNATANPFAAVTVADTDVPVQTLTVTVGVDDAAKGAFTPASLTAGGFVADGAVYRVAGTQAAVTAALRALVFAPAENRLVPAARETVRFTITASDGVAPVVVNAASTVQSLSVNDAPTVSLPSAPGVTRNASTTFGASTGNAILVGSRDAGPNPVRLLVSVPAGSLTVYAFAGVAVTGNGTASLRLQGNLADVNAALDGMTFAPVVGAFGSVRLRFRCDDLDAGASGLYVMAETSVTVVNTAPAAASALSFETGRDAPLNVPAATGLVPAGTDAEGDALTVRLARNPAVGALALRTDGSFTYTPRAGYVGAVTFAFRYFDGQLFSGDVTVTVNVRA